MRRSDNRLAPAAAIAAVLAASTTIVGLAYWVGDAIVPGLAAVVRMSSADAAPAVDAEGRLATAQRPADSGSTAEANGAATRWVRVRQDARRGQ